MRHRLVVLASVGFALAIGPTPSLAQEPSVAHGTVTLTRVTADRWTAVYELDRPVEALAFGPDAAGYRASAWRVTTPGAAAGDVVTLPPGGTRLAVDVVRHTRFDHDSYAPMVPFSDGGMALYAAYFTARAVVNGDTVPVDLDYRFEPLPGERVIRPAGESPQAYVYFGPQEAVATPHARMVVDTGAPAWLRDELIRVIDAATAVYADSLGGDLPRPPLVLIGAAEVDSADGISVKGGAVGSQFVMLLRGRGLNDPTPPLRAAFARLTAHELAHLWQVNALANAFDGDGPWLHEGSAEAMAVAALRAADIWDAAESEAFADNAAHRCTAALDGGTLAEAAARGGSDASYACGFRIYHSAPQGPFQLWMSLVGAVAAGQPYSQATLDSIMRADGASTAVPAVPTAHGDPPR